MSLTGYNQSAITSKKVVKIYQDQFGREPYTEWIRAFKDPIIRARIRKRISKVEEGNLGVLEPVGEGVLELKLHFGPGYRVYFGEFGTKLVVILCGGDKSSQKEDIRKAKNLWKEFKELK